LRHLKLETDQDPPQLQRAAASRRTVESHRRRLGELRATLHDHAAFRTVDDDEPIAGVASLDEQGCASFERVDRNTFGATALKNEIVQGFNNVDVAACHIDNVRRARASPCPEALITVFP
jgi:hypothetical protein